MAVSHTVKGVPPGVAALLSFLDLQIYQMPGVNAGVVEVVWLNALLAVARLLVHIWARGTYVFPEIGWARAGSSS